MDKYVLLAVDDNPNYLYLLPFVCKSWELHGWKCKIAFNMINDHNKINVITNVLDSIGVTYITEFINKQSDTQNKALYTQCHRLYMAKDMSDDDYLIMSDADMFIASDFLNRDYDKVNAYGHDLTGFTQIPMCYVGMTAKKWKDLMGNFNVEEDLKIFAKKDAQDFYVAWGCDQDILTGKIRTIFGYHGVNFINRGNDQNNSGLAMGRWDRYNWVKPASQIHDCHLSAEGWTNGGTDRLIDMCNTIYPDTNWEWIYNYQTNFKQIYGL